MQQVPQVPLHQTLYMPQQHTLQAAHAMHATTAPIHPEQRQLQQGPTQQLASLKAERQTAIAAQAAMAQMQVGARFAEHAATNDQIQEQQNSRKEQLQAQSNC